MAAAPKNPLIAQFFKDENDYYSKLGKVKRIQPKDALAEGDTFPDVVLTDTQNRIVSIANIAKEKNVVLFFYPGDKEGLRYPELMGCTPQACSFRDSMKEFASENTVVYGVSFQTQQRQKDFVQKEQLNFNILNDSDLMLATKLGVAVWLSQDGEKFPSRQTYVIAKGGIITRIYRDIGPEQIQGHVAEVLTHVKEINMSI